MKEGFFFTKEERDDLLFTLQFALDVVENADLGNTTNPSNWTLDTSLEEQIEVVDSKLEQVLTEHRSTITK